MKNYKYILSIILGASAFSFYSCSDDMVYPEIKPEIVISEGKRILKFSIAEDKFNFPNEVDSVSIALISKTGVAKCYSAGVKKEEGHFRFSMVIPEGEKIEDGRYIMTMKRAEGRSIPGRLSVDFKDNLIQDLSIIIPKYMLDGDGTEESPYIIGNDDDFSMFLINLSQDEESYGAGLVFKQTANVKAPTQSSITAGRGYWGAPFAGIYDGGGFAIENMYYRGGGRESSDTGIGIFNELLGTAHVSNLTLSAVAVSGLYKDSGAVAGYTSGDVTIQNIKVSGFFGDGFSIGGIVGVVRDGKLTIKDVKLQLSVNGTDNVGGIVGTVLPNGTLFIEGVRTPEYQFLVSGHNNIGGIIGLDEGTAEIRDIRLEHKVTGEDDDLKIIEGNENVGGVIGFVDTQAKNLHLQKNYILCPLGGDKATSVGGVIGSAKNSALIEMNECRVYSVVRGVTNIGGIIGYANFPSGAKGIKISGDDLTTRVAADDAEAHIKGVENVGGFAGKWQGPLEINTNIKINLPVTGETNVGGAIGSIQSSEVPVSGFMFGQSPSSTGQTMKVSGSENIGGFAGHVVDGGIKGSDKFDYSENGSPIRVPDPERFTPVNRGVVSGNENVGGVVGYAENSSVRAVCGGASVTGTKCVGGVIGKFYVSKSNKQIEDCTFKGIIDCEAADYVGGIAGMFYSNTEGLVHDCVNYSNIKGGPTTGGVIGYFYKDFPSDFKKPEKYHFDLMWCVNRGNISGGEFIGGIMGRQAVYPTPSNPNYADVIAESIVSVSNCMNSGKITGKGGNGNACIGGIVGATDKWSSICYSANHGEVYGEGQFQGVGGIAGRAGRDASSTGLMDSFLNHKMTECTNTGRISSGNANSYVGGLIGYQEEGANNEVTNLHNLGEIPCKQNHDSGGIIGTVDHLTHIYRVVNQGMVSHGNATIGTHKSGSIFYHSSLYFLEGTGKNWPSATKVSKEDFNKQSSFGGLDFDQVWKMTSNGPVLNRCPWRDPSMK